MAAHSRPKAYLPMPALKPADRNLFRPRTYAELLDQLVYHSESA